MPKFFEQYLKTLSKKRKTELLNWWTESTDRDIIFQMFTILNPSTSQIIKYNRGNKSNQNEEPNI